MLSSSVSVALNWNQFSDKSAEESCLSNSIYFRFYFAHLHLLRTGCTSKTTVSDQGACFAKAWNKILRYLGSISWFMLKCFSFLRVCLQTTTSESSFSLRVTLLVIKSSVSYAKEKFDPAEHRAACAPAAFSSCGFVVLACALLKEYHFSANKQFC